jgi:hypothetical protein
MYVFALCSLFAIYVHVLLVALDPSIYCSPCSIEIKTVCSFTENHGYTGWVVSFPLPVTTGLILPMPPSFPTWLGKMS